ncbi:MAG: Uncharacterized protein G01um101419_293 [Parcubacteria group bacterium Gr01-1014_19]|nr:MAG: Uncharacterized protein G01um101419_293 [Parcubacteria group bacterium Gr01-1014_19]
MEQKTLRELIIEKLDARGLNLEKIFFLTNIPRHYLENILAGEWHKLPAAPYARGYFKKIEVTLECQTDELWDLYREEAEIKSSGSSDKLPENRFALKGNPQKWLWVGVAGLFVIIYLGFNAYELIGIPPLEVRNPLSATVISILPQYELRGKIEPKDKVFVNGEEVIADKDGGFSASYDLHSGLNTFEIAARRFLGREAKMVKQIIYQPVAAEDVQK